MKKISGIVTKTNVHAGSGLSNCEQATMEFNTYDEIRTLSADLSEDNAKTLMGLVDLLELEAAQYLLNNSCSLPERLATLMGS